MEITEVRITLTFDSSFVVRGLKVISGANGYFVSMPSRRRKDGTFQDLAHPVTNEMRKKIEEAVLDAFEAEVNRSSAAAVASPAAAAEEL
jgi:DNA-binding cell septation regulator SpoVG